MLHIKSSRLRTLIERAQARVPGRGLDDLVACPVPDLEQGVAAHIQRYPDCRRSPAAWQPC